mgnify:CR=1 FL=1
MDSDFAQGADARGERGTGWRCSRLGVVELAAMLGRRGGRWISPEARLCWVRWLLCGVGATMGMARWTAAVGVPPEKRKGRAALVVPFVDPGVGGGGCR